MSALTDEEVGKYLNENFISSYQKAGTFKIVGGAKQGGNVACYFCTPGGRVLHAVAGPVNAVTMLKEARWVVSTWGLALLESRGDGARARFRTFFRDAHAARLGSRDTPAKQALVHRMLTASPLPRLGDFYPTVWETVLGEVVSTEPVQEGAGAGGGRAVRHHHRPAGPRREDEEERLQAELLRCARRKPAPAEVESGRALNDLLSALLALRSAHVAVLGPDLPLRAELLGKVRLTASAHGEGLVLLESLHRQGRLGWPALLGGDELAAVRERFEAITRAALAQAARGDMNLETSAGLVSALEVLEQRVAAVRHNLKDIHPDLMIEANRFLRQLKTEAALLRVPGAARHLAPSQTARGRNVAELVEDLAERGLRFAPAAAGEEGAYVALHQKLATYAVDVANAWDPWE